MVGLGSGKGGSGSGGGGGGSSGNANGIVGLVNPRRVARIDHEVVSYECVALGAADPTVEEDLKFWRKSAKAAAQYFVSQGLKQFALEHPDLPAQTRTRLDQLV